jgi:hypothetical protein
VSCESMRQRAHRPTRPRNPTPPDLICFLSKRETSRNNGRWRAYGPTGAALDLLTEQATIMRYVVCVETGRLRSKSGRENGRKKDSGREQRSIEEAQGAWKGR